MKAFISGGVTGNSQELGNMADVANAETEQLVVIYDVLVCERGQFERDIIGFGPIGLGVLFSEASPSGCVDSQAQHTMIKT